MATKIEFELLIYNSSYLKNEEKKMTKEGAMAKYYSSEVVQVSSDAVQILEVMVIQKIFLLKDIIEILSCVQLVKVHLRFRN